MWRCTPAPRSTRQLDAMGVGDQPVAGIVHHVDASLHPIEVGRRRKGLDEAAGFLWKRVHRSPRVGRVMGLEQAHYQGGCG